MSSRIGRVYIGNLPDDVTKDELYDFTDKYGRVLDVDIKYGKTSNNTAYAFVTFRDEEDARECIRKRDGAKFADLRVRVEAAGGRRRQNNERGPPRRSEYRLYITGLPRGGASWQDLKDHFRTCGDVGYANVEGDVGVVEFHEKGAMIDALEKMRDVDFRGQHGDCKIEISTDPPSGFEMRSCPPRDYGGGSRYYGRRRDRSDSPDRYRGRYSRDRNASRSPRRSPRDYDNRRDYDDRRSTSRRRSVSPEDRDHKRARSRSVSDKRRSGSISRRSRSPSRSRTKSPRK